MNSGSKHDKRKARQIEEYMEEYRRETGLSETETPKEEDRQQDAESPPPLPTPPEASAGVSVVDRISHQELDAFDPAVVVAGTEEVEGGVQPVSEHRDLYRAAVTVVLEAIRQAAKGQTPELERIEELVEEMSDSIARDSELLLVSTDRTQKFAVSTHCANVAIYALRISQALNLDREKQIRVGLAGLLHEVGVIKLAQQAIHREQVDPEVRKRPAHSAQILSGLGPGYQWLAETVGQVYEREDGGGSPLGLAGKDIRAEAKILAIADVVEAGIHERPYREALTGYQLFYELTTGKTKGFSDRVVKAALKSFSLYPYNEYVVLSTGEVGRVVEINPKNLLRPRIIVLYGVEGQTLERPREVDLQQKPSTSITAAIPYTSLPDQLV